VARVSVNASLSADVVDVVEREVTVREVTEDVMLEKARRVHRPVNSLLNCKSPFHHYLRTRANIITAVVVSAVVLDVVELLPLLRYCIMFSLLCASTDISYISS
jgi:hypothetical protein